MVHPFQDVIDPERGVARDDAERAGRLGHREGGGGGGQAHRPRRGVRAERVAHEDVRAGALQPLDADLPAGETAGACGDPSREEGAAVEGRSRAAAGLAALGQHGVDRHGAPADLRFPPCHAPVGAPDVPELEEARLERVAHGARRGEHAPEDEGEHHGEPDDHGASTPAASGRATS